MSGPHLVPGDPVVDPLDAEQLEPEPVQQGQQPVQGGVVAADEAQARRALLVDDDDVVDLPSQQRADLTLDPDLHGAL